MRIYKLILCLILLLSTPALYAQEELEILEEEEEERSKLKMDYSKESRFVVGLNGGINVSRIGGFKHEGYSTGNRSLVRFTAGLSIDYLITPKLQLLSGLNYNKKGSGLVRTNEPGGFIPSYNSTWLQIPLHIGYRLKTGNAANLVFHGGIFYALGINGDIEWVERNSSMMRKRIEFFSLFNKHDYGLGVGVDINVKNYVISISYDQGLRDLAKSGFEFPDMRSQDYSSKFGKFLTSNLTITFGYKLRYMFRSKE